MVDEIISQKGKIDILFNNAGISGVGTLHETSEELWNKFVNANIKGVYLMSKYVIPHMIEKNKDVVLALTNSMQVDYAPHNIRVNALLPGTILKLPLKGLKNGS
jgi:NAD(P)-dependent dehydrogenase (short-subunit alcohol dehydrogenase family)